MYGIVNSGSASTGNAPIAQGSSDSESGSESDAFDTLSGATFDPDESRSASSFDPDEHTLESKKNPQNNFSSRGDLQSELKTENKNLKFLNDHLGQEVEEANKILRKYRQGIDKMKEQKKNDIQELKDKLFEVQKNYDMSREYLKREKESNESLLLKIEELKSSKTSNKSNEIELGRLLQETVELKATIVDLQNEIKNIKAEAKTQKEKYENEIKTLQEREKLKQLVINKLEAQKTSMQNLIDSLKESVDNMSKPSNKGPTQPPTRHKKKK